MPVLFLVLLPSFCSTWALSMLIGEWRYGIIYLLQSRSVSPCTLDVVLPHTYFYCSHMFPLWKIILTLSVLSCSVSLLVFFTKLLFAMLWASLKLIREWRSGEIYELWIILWKNVLLVKKGWNRLNHWSIWKYRTSLQRVYNPSPRAFEILSFRSIAGRGNRYEQYFDLSYLIKMDEFYE